MKEPTQIEPARRSARERLVVFGESQLDRIPQLACLDREQHRAIRIVAQVLPFRVNRYVVEELIDWKRVPDDPIFQLTFPQPGMLEPAHFQRVADLLRRGASREALRHEVEGIRLQLNPHPAGQQKHNVPFFEGAPLEGAQHKYRETVLVFPGQGQTCHSYCTFCFRWAQFVGMRDLRFAATDVGRVLRYLAQHREVTDLLLTGGDPMVMKAHVLARYLEPLLEERFEHISTVRIGTKSLTFWPQRFVTDDDADDVLRLFERLSKAGKHVAFMAHFDHWREMETEICRTAIRRLQNAGIVLRSQAPLLQHVNDSAQTWARMWRMQVELGIVPYYMFVERDTGARRYFEVPLGRGWNIYRNALQRVSGLGRTARGPSMSTGAGKIEIQGVTEILGREVFALRFIQARNPEWVQKPFFARFDPEASWWDDLQPAFGDESFFFEDEYRRICAQRESVRAM